MPQPKTTLEVIPEGIYCYNAGGICPHWRRDGEWTYCEHLKIVSEDHTQPEPTTTPQTGYELPDFSLIWDQVKECGINDDIEEDEIA